MYLYKKLFMIYLITKIDDEYIIIGELTEYSRFVDYSKNVDKSIKKIYFSYKHKKVKEWIDKNKSSDITLIIWSDNQCSLFSECKQEESQEGNYTFSYNMLWPFINIDKNLINQFKRDQKKKDKKKKKI